jgi:hypothetical protein
MRDGWEAIEEIGTEVAEVPSAQEQIDALHVDVFNTPAGRRLLSYWKVAYLDEPVCVPGAGAEVGFHREGQNSVVRDTVKRLKRGLTPRV